MLAFTWARNALGQRLIEFGTALVDDDRLRMAIPTTPLRVLPTPTDSVNLHRPATPDTTAALMADRSVSNGVWPGRVW